MGLRVCVYYTALFFSPFDVHIKAHLHLARAPKDGAPTKKEV